MTIMTITATKTLHLGWQSKASEATRRTGKTKFFVDRLRYPTKCTFRHNSTA
jgi:hypothetical protein